MTHVLNGKVMIITGASGGIGSATARVLAPLGVKFVLSALPGDDLDALAAELGPNAIAAPTDLTVPADIRHMVEQAISHFGRVDVLFANAGIFLGGSVAEGDPDAWEQMLRVNVDGVLRSVRAVLPHMIAQQSGDIVITTSISGNVDIHGEPVYSASKHAVQGFVHTLRRQVLKDGIRVMSIAPGVVATGLWGAARKAEIDQKLVEGKALRAEDVAGAVLFMLAQPRHVTIRDLVMLPQAQDI